MTEPTVTVDTILVSCRAALGGCALVADRTMPHGEAVTLEVEDRHGVRWIAKHVRRAAKYAQELTAYREWVPALGPAAPTLHSAHDDLRILLISRLPGEPAEHTPAEHDPAVHRQFGVLTRLLHESAPPVTDTGFATDLAAKLEEYIERGDGLLTAQEIGFARGRIAALGEGLPVVTVPCHLDNQPRNWIVGGPGEYGLIDFGHAKRHHWIVDVNRMATRQWRDVPELAAAFFDGYGRAPSDDDLRVLDSYLAFAGLSTVVWATEHDDDAFAAEGRARLRDMITGSGVS